MARAVILDFKDNEAAEMFVQLLLQAQSDPETGAPIAMSTILAAHAAVKGLFARPTAGCHCRGSARNHKLAYTRTVRFGWWVHAVCRKPSALVVKNFYKNIGISAGSNLLHEIEERLVPKADTAEVAAGDSSASVVGDTPAASPEVAHLSNTP